jgi:hypothetical protein
MPELNGENFTACRYQQLCSIRESLDLHGGKARLHISRVLRTHLHAYARRVYDTAHGAKTYAMRTFDSKYVPSTVGDAVPISADQFVTVRGIVSQDPRDRGLVMSWVRIKEIK